jgi:hypothetical protein
MLRAFLKDSLLEHLHCLFFKFFTTSSLALGRVYFVESEPESEIPLLQAYVEERHTLQVSPYNLSKRAYPLFS